MFALLVACSQPHTAKTPAPAPITLTPGLPEGEAGTKLKAAADQMDEGHLDEAIATLEKLHRELPNSALVLHELGLAYRLQKQPQKAVALWTPFRDALPVETLAGLASALDEAGQSAQAQALLRKEIERHPKSGILYSELATALRGVGKQQEALALYEQSIEVDPAFPASYLHAAEILANTPNRGMALLYGETFRVLEPTGDRSGADAELMVQVCKNAVTLGGPKGSNTTAKIMLAGDAVIRPPGGLPLANVFELAFGPGLVIAHMSGLKLKTLHAARRSFVDALNGPAKDSPLAAMPIMRWLRALDAAGHLEAYDYWLYGPAMQDEAVAWFKAHKAEADAMGRYVLEHPLFPTK
jgi:tetratricopeptide (TPR) repeat protein